MTLIEGAILDIGLPSTHHLLIHFRQHLFTRSVSVLKRSERIENFLDLGITEGDTTVAEGRAIYLLEAEPELGIIGRDQDEPPTVTLLTLVLRSGECHADACLGLHNLHQDIGACILLTPTQAIPLIT